MSEYIPTTEEIREYVERGGEPRPWVELDEAEEAREKARAEAFDRWLAAHDAEGRAQGEPSDAQVEAALARINLYGFNISPMVMRRALRAASEAGDA